MPTKLENRPEEDENVKPLFDSNTPKSVYDEQFDKIVGRNFADNYPEGDQITGSDPSLADEKKERIKKAVDRDELANAENSADTADPGAVPDAESRLSDTDPNQLGKEGYRDEGGKSGAKRTIYTKKRAAAAGGIVGGVVGLFAIFSIFSGPLQFIHAAQLLQNFHFGEQEDFFQDRTTKIYRYLKWKDQPQNRRLSLAGHYLANKLEPKFNAAGIEFEYSNAGTLKSITIDEKLAKRSGVDVEAIKNDFDFTGENGKLNVVIENKLSTALKERRLFKSMRKGVGADGLVSAIEGRQVFKKFGITLHPLVKLDQKAKGTIADLKEKWKERKKSQETEGERIGASAETKEGEDGPRPESTSAADETNIIGNPEGATGQEAVGKVKGKLLGKLGVASAIAGIACTVNGLAKDSRAIEYANIVIPSLRIGGRVLSLGAQVMSGHDVDITQLGFEAAQLYDKSNDNDPSTKPSSFFAAQSIQAESGQEQNGPEQPNSTRIGGAKNILAELRDKVPALGGTFLNTACGAVNSLIGQVVSIGIDVVTGGPFSAAGGQILGFAASPFINDLAGLIAGKAINSEIVGATLGAVANQGAFFLANEQFVSMGAKALSNQSRLELKEYENKKQLAINGEPSWSERYLSLTNPNSLTAKVIDNYNGSTTESMASLFRLPRITSIFSALLPRTKAASNYDYGVDKFAYSVDEIEKSNSDESYANPYENANIINSHIDELNDKYSEKCFGIKFNGANFTMTTQVNLQTYDSDCKLDKEVESDVAFRYRLYIADTMTSTTYACYEGDEQSCINIGASNTASTTAGLSQTNTGNGNNVFVIGDSLTLGMESAGLDSKLEAAGWEVAGSQAAVGASVPSSLAALKGNESTIASVQGTIVVALGTNDGGSQASFETRIQNMINELRRINPNARIVWVNAYAINRDYSGVNAALATQAGPQNYTVLDWSAEVNANSAKYPFARDGIHLSPSGYAAKADWLVSSLGAPPL